MSAYIHAMNSRDLAAASAMIAEDAVFLFSNETTHIGKAAILQAIQNNFETIEDDTFRISNLTWLVKTDDLAACIYDFNWTGKIDGKPVSGSGRGTSLLRRENGGWRIVNEHLSKGQYRN